LQEVFNRGDGFVEGGAVFICRFELSGIVLEFVLLVFVLLVFDLGLLLGGWGGCLAVDVVVLDDAIGVVVAFSHLDCILVVLCGSVVDFMVRGLWSVLV
jgi:hypothetical protein